MRNREVGALTSDEAFDLLRKPYRRRLLMALLDHNPQDEAFILPARTTDDQEDSRVLISMTHVHLPKLASLNVIEWDHQKNVVTRGPAFDELRPLLELINRHRDELSNS